LSEAGVDVEVLTALPNYPQGRVQDGFRSRLYVTRHTDAGRVVHLPLWPSRSLQLVPRMASYLSFVLSSLLLGPLLVRRPDVLICESPPLFLGLSAIVLKLLFRCRLIFNVSDLWPESAVRMGLHARPSLVNAAKRLEQLCYRMSDAVTGQSHGIVSGVRSVHPQARVELIPNGCDCQMFQPARRDPDLRARHDLHDKVVVGYAGLIGRAQGVDLVVELAEAFRHDKRVAFMLAGDGPDREVLEQELASRRLPNVVFTGWLPKDAMPAVVASFDVAWIPLRYFIPGALPSKIYEAMASQVPVLLSAAGDPRELLERAEAGIVADYGDIERTVAAIRKLADQPELRKRLGANGSRYVLAHHQRHQIARRLLNLVNSLTGVPREAARRIAA
jgi:glycosyltransferase involved in cell wall biosynthesis